MSNTVRNVISIIVASIAAAGIAVVVAMSFITISPSAYGKFVDAAGMQVSGRLLDYDAVSIYYAGERLPVSTTGALQGNGSGSGKYTIDDIFEKMNFSLFSTAILFNYDYDVSFYENSRIRENEMTAGELRTTLDAFKGPKENGYLFEVSNKSLQTMVVSDYWGRSEKISFDTVVFKIDSVKVSDWPQSVEAYAYVSDSLYSSSDMPGENANSSIYYRLKFSAKTSDLVSTLDSVYDIDSAADLNKEAEEPSGEGDDQEID